VKLRVLLNEGLESTPFQRCLDTRATKSSLTDNNTNRGILPSARLYRAGYHTEFTFLEEQLLFLDRQAILGSLSAGLVHAVNNILSSVLGQVDLLLLDRKEPQLKIDLEHIATTCEKGVLLTKSLTQVISAMKETRPTDSRLMVEALLVLLGRIYRRAGVEKESNVSGSIPFALHGDEYVQAMFHLILMSHDALAAQGVASRKLISRLSSSNNLIYFDLESLTPLAHISPSDLPEPVVGVMTDADWQRWVLTTITRRCGGEWKVELDGRKLSLIWPAASSGSTMIY